ncbi:MAG: hypothetical protein J6386_23245 [Candidatus Synoicihabitans palmerolidicus]|nr:hypothetical protein [Candidatus Synoicihabitans palmerolidicus]
MPSPGRITDLRVIDVRFPTSLELDGSDAMNPDPDYSAAYVVLTTDTRRCSRGSRPDVHHRPWQRDRGRRRRRPASPGHWPGTCRFHGRPRCHVEAREMLTRLSPSRQARIDEMLAQGYPAYTTSAGWLGYPEDKIRQRCAEGISQGFTHFKLKVGADRADDGSRNPPPRMISSVTLSSPVPCVHWAPESPRGNTATIA